MMSKERELLKEQLRRALDSKERYSIWLLRNDIEIDRLTSQIQPKQEPLSEDKLDALAEANITDEGIAGYYLGFRDAEKAHGIGVDDETV
jgi:hypothetical protein